METLNWWAIVVITYWISATIGAVATKDTYPFLPALAATVLTGIAYAFATKIGG